MTDEILDLLRTAMSSPWVYVALFTLAWLDGFAPAFPSETALITAGVFAATGRPNVAVVLLVAAAGALAGDHTSYALGHRFRARATDRARLGGRRGRALRRAHRALDRRGGLLLVVARYVPGGRTAVTLTAGATGYGLRRFTPYATLAAITWAGYGTAVGYLGGAAFTDRPLHGVAVGLGLALGITLLVETARALAARHRNHTPTIPTTGPPLPHDDPATSHLGGPPVLGVVEGDDHAVGGR